jgi:acyl dehydratase
MSAEGLAKLASATVGEQVCTASYRLTRDSLVRYAGASGDFNPIHYRDDIAQAVGLPGVLAHGMLTMGVAVQPVVDLVGGNDRILDYQVRFTKPVVVPAKGYAEIHVVGALGAVEADRARIDLQVSFAEQTVLGKAQVWVKLD